MMYPLNFLSFSNKYPVSQFAGFKEQTKIPA